MAQNKNSSKSEGARNKFDKESLPKTLSDRKEQRSSNKPSPDHIAEEVVVAYEQGHDRKAAKSASKQELALPRVRVGNDAVNVLAARSKSSLKDEDTFSDYIRKVKDRMRTVSNVGAGKTAQKRDSFNDKVSRYIDRAMIKIRTTTIVDNDKDVSNFK